MTLLGSTENETTKDKNCGNVLSLQNDEVVLIHWNIVNSDYQYDSRVLYNLFKINHLVNY